MGWYHFEVGAKVRKTIQEPERTMPEKLSVVDSIKKLEKPIGNNNRNESLSE